MRCLCRCVNLACVGVTVSVLAACELPDEGGSGNVPTDEIYADIWALTESNGQTHVTMTMRERDASGTVITAGIGEELKATVGGTTATLLVDASRTTHYAVFQGDASGTNVVVDFQRDQDEDATSTVTLPEAKTVSLQERMGGTTVQRGNDVFFQWEPTGGPDLEWSVRGDCVASQSGIIRDDGDFQLGTQYITPSADGAGDTCDVTIFLSITVDGTIDSKFADGSRMRATRRSPVTFSSTPGANE